MQADDKKQVIGAGMAVLLSWQRHKYTSTYLFLYFGDMSYNGMSLCQTHTAG